MFLLSTTKSYIYVKKYINVTYTPFFLIVGLKMKVIQNGLFLALDKS